VACLSEGCEIVTVSGVDRLVTVMLNTVREDGAQYKSHDVLRTVAEDIRRQTFDKSQLELVIVDGLHPFRLHTFDEHDYPFRIVHVPPRPTAMVRDRRCAISAYKNTAIAHARGELIITFDDCATVDPEFVERAWLAWSRDRMLLCAMFREIHSTPDITIPEWGHDSRASVYLDSTGRCVGGDNPMIPPMYGFAAFPLEAALALNGYDEYFDGAQGLEDVDMGIRLQKAGYRLVVDRRHIVFLLGPSPPWSPRLFDSGNHDVHCNQTTLRIQLDAGQVRANEHAWTEAEWAKVAPRCYLLREDSRCSLDSSACPHLGRCADLEHPSLRKLREDLPVFDLAEIRAATLNLSP
jgi:hypothetical protein